MRFWNNLHKVCYSEKIGKPTNSLVVNKTKRLKGVPYTTGR